MNTKKMSVGFYLTLFATLLVIAAFVVYQTVMYKYGPVYVFLVAEVVAVLGIMIMKMNGKETVLFDFLPILAGVLDAGALIGGVALMVNQIGYVISGLDEISTIQTWIVFEALAAAALIVQIIGAFLPQTKEA